MIITDEIIDFLGYKEYLVSLNSNASEKLSAIKKHVLDEINTYNIDNVYFSNDFPCIYFKSIKSFDSNIINDILSVHRKVWNQRKVPFLYISSPSEIRIYNCFNPPLDPDKKNENIDSIELYKYSVKDGKEALEELKEIFGRVSIDSGTFWKYEEYAKKLDINTRVDKSLVKNLQNARTKLLNLGLNIEVVHDLLLRSLFILYLEDREATNNTFYNEYLDNAISYFDILENIDSTYKLFSKLEESFHGNLALVSEIEKRTVALEHLQVIKNCFWGNDVNSGQLRMWKAFDFSVIPVELISEIYEEFLSVEQGEQKKSKEGVYYTPHSMVEFILNEQLPWADENNKKYDLRVIDITCGSGIFLVECFRRLVDRWKFSHKDRKISFKDLDNLLTLSIFGVEKNPDAIKVAAFSLYLALLDYLDPKIIWTEASFPYLINDPDSKENEKNGNNLFKCSSLGDGDFNNGKYDLIVGNPPFKSASSGTLSEEIKKYCNEQNFAHEMVLPFLHKASELCSDIGKIALITTTKVLLNKNSGYKNFRNFLFNQNYVEAVYNFSDLSDNKKTDGGGLFKSAKAPISVLFYQNTLPEKPNDYLIYCVPKSSSKNNLVDGIVIDSSEIKFLPRKECIKDDALIWKVAMWGCERDLYLINKVEKFDSLEEILKNKDGWYKGVGLKLIADQKDSIFIDEKPNLIQDMPFIKAKNVKRYYTDESLTKDFRAEAVTEDYIKKYSTPDGIIKLRRSGSKKTYKAPHLLIKEGQSNKKFCASYLDYDCTFKHAVFGISSDNSILLKSLAAFLNSSFVFYFLFLTSGRWGVDRPAVTFEEILNIPALSFIDDRYVKQLSDKVDDIIKLIKENKDDKKSIEIIEKIIDDIVYKSLNLTEEEIHLVKDTIEYTIDLFQEGEKSKAIKPTVITEMETYSKVICENLNSLLEFSDSHTWSTIYNLGSDSSLNMTAIHFSDQKDKGTIEKVDSTKEISDLLNTIENIVMKILRKYLF